MSKIHITGWAALPIFINHYLIQTLFIIVIFAILNVDAATWSYPNRTADEQFPQWGGICDYGTRQSPIDLSKRNSMRGFYDYLEFKNYDVKQKNLLLVNNGHTIQLSQFSPPLSIAGGPLLNTYVTEQIHMHWRSEHTFNQLRYSLEIHIVNRNARYATMDQAIQYKDGVAVVGVLYHLSYTASEVLNVILSNAASIRGAAQIDKPIKMKDDLVPRSLFPEITGYFSYPGSLTTPTCAESVTWIVLEKSFPITDEQVLQFQQLHDSHDNPMDANYRDIQNTYGRQVVYTEMLDRNGARTTFSGSLLLAFIVVVGHSLH